MRPKMETKLNKIQTVIRILQSPEGLKLQKYFFILIFRGYFQFGPHIYIYIYISHFGLLDLKA